MVELARHARQSGCAAVCVLPPRLAATAAAVRGSGTAVAAVVAFPFGAATVSSKCFEALEALRLGATELDVVCDLSAVRRGDVRVLEREIGEISNATYRAKSRQKFDETKGKYASLATSLKKAESSMDPVLTHLKDNVLFLKHNLNAAAIGGLSSEMDRIESDIEELIADMRASIAEADRFLSTLQE